MGIKDLSSFLRKNHPDILQTGHIAEFSEQKIAIDTTAFVFKYHTAAGDRWWRSMVNFILSFRQHNVHPVFVFDSANRPVEKSATMQSRRDNWNRTISRRDNLEAALKQHSETGIVTSPLQKYLISTTGTATEQALFGEDSESVVDTDSAVKALNNLKNSTRELPKEYFTRIQAFLDVCGITWAVAPYEADPLCARLCKTREVSAVLSPDSDMLAYGAPIVIKEYTPSNGETTVINYNDVLNSLGFTAETFTDFCVMLGNDNNPRIPKVGPVKCYRLLTEYGSIDDIPELDVTPLNHQRSREIFGGFYENDFDQPIGWCVPPDLNEVDSFLHDTDSRIDQGRLQRCLGYRVVELVD